MTKEEFKKRRESDENWWNITFDEVAECAKQRWLFSTPKVCRMEVVLYRVLEAAKVNDLEEFKPDDLSIM